MLMEETISNESIYKGRVVELVMRQVLLPNGQMAEREIVVHNGGAGVLALDEDGNCFMVRQFRTAVEKELLEMPAGKLEKNEDPLSCAVRELEEETGCIAGKMEFLGQFLPTPGYDTEVLYLYLATELSQGKINLDEGEFLSTVKLPFKSLYQMALSGQIEDAKTVIAILLTAQHKSGLI